MDRSTELFEMERTKQDAVEVNQATGHRGLYILGAFAGSIAFGYFVSRATGNTDWGFAAGIGAMTLVCAALAIIKTFCGEVVKCRHALERLLEDE